MKIVCVFAAYSKLSVYLQKSRPILNQKMVDNKYDVVLAAAAAVYLLCKCLFVNNKKE
jgi:hypothetical protein